MVINSVQAYVTSVCIFWTEVVLFRILQNPRKQRTLQCFCFWKSMWISEGAYEFQKNNSLLTKFVTYISIFFAALAIFTTIIYTNLLHCVVISPGKNRLAIPFHLIKSCSGLGFCWFSFFFKLTVQRGLMVSNTFCLKLLDTSYKFFSFYQEVSFFL